MDCRERGRREEELDELEKKQEKQRKKQRREWVRLKKPNSASFFGEEESGYVRNAEFWSVFRSISLEEEQGKNRGKENRGNFGVCYKIKSFLFIYLPFSFPSSCVCALSPN